MADGFPAAGLPGQGMPLDDIGGGPPLTWQAGENALWPLDAHDAALEALTARALQMDPEGPAHAERVGRMAGALAAALGLPDADQRLLRRAAVLHDLGKLALPRAILDYAHVLDRTRRRIMQQHALLGAALLAAAREPWLRLARSICLCHHERWDGSGYPAGLAGAAIPLAARLTSVVDVYDALRSQRCYKRAMDHAQAMAILLQGDDRVQPAHFDPEALQALQRAELTVMQIHDALPDPTAGHG